MGITIHYNGLFNKKASLPDMIEEVKDIAEVYEWEYSVHEKDFPHDSLNKEEYNNEIYGISVTAPECEPLYLSFLSNGRMSNYINLDLWGDSEDEKMRQYVTMLSTKTQFAGIQVHKLIIHLLKYLDEKYFAELNIMDETDYWETGDEDLLEERFEEMNFLLDQFWFGLNNFPKDEDETFESYFKRMLEDIHRRQEE